MGWGRNTTLKDALAYISEKTRKRGTNPFRIVYLFNCSPMDSDHLQTNLRTYGELQLIKKEFDNYGKQNWAVFLRESEIGKRGTRSCESGLLERTTTLGLGPRSAFVTEEDDGEKALEELEEHKYAMEMF